eukprot:TRINITY_DN232_c0_g2_i2.p1 TRINITY_DN232_c0_g2~~TRINITY_DN232_c0_g2_i2.p1  ORF type:complete len:527 (-),score=91.36 TRINITY_DN232_c0_g2_i2:457-2037(-)
MRTIKEIKKVHDITGRYTGTAILMESEVKNTEIACPEVCKDHKLKEEAGWINWYADESGFDCNWFKYDPKTRCARPKAKVVTGGKTAHEACCACGGGTTGADSDESGTESIIEYYDKGKGQGDCPSGEQIMTKAECQTALNFLGMRSDSWYEGNHNGIVGKCSWRDFANHNAHFNAADHGSARDDLHPICKRVPEVNMARGKVVTSSSIGWGGVPSRVVDGNHGNGAYKSNTCAHTLEKASWIKVNLGDTADVSSVLLVARADECGTNCVEQTSDWTVRIGYNGDENDTLCADNVDASGGIPKVVKCEGEPIRGRFVTVFSDTWMVLCEIEVYGYKVNMARGKVVTSSSIGWGGVPSRVVDGNHGNGAYKSNTCAHTLEKASWIKVNLGDTADVSSVLLVARADECGTNCVEQTSDWTVRIGYNGDENDTLCADNVDASGGIPKVVKCEGEPIRGRFVTVFSDTWMVLCEIEVYGYKAKETHTCASYNPSFFGVDFLCHDVGAWDATQADRPCSDTFQCVVLCCTE